jgi:hypothetical protein
MQKMKHHPNPQPRPGIERLTIATSKANLAVVDHLNAIYMILKRCRGVGIVALDVCKILDLSQWV